MLLRQSVLACLICTTSFSVAAKDLVSDGVDYGKLSGGLMAAHVITGDENGFDPSQGSAYMATLKYHSPSFSGFSFGLGEYLVGDLFGLSEFTPSDPTDKLARGLFVTDDGSSKGLLGEVFLQYKNGMVGVKAGRQMVDTPLTKASYSTMPNFYGAAMADIKPTEDLSFKLGQITEMSFGARTMTEWGLIGEGTPTAGVGIKPDTIGQAEFHSISTAAVGKGTEDTNGLTVIGATYKGFKNVSLSAWDFYADDIANNVYLEGDLTIPSDAWKGKFKLSAQFLNQSEEGDALAGDLDYSMFGLKASFGTKKWSAYAAANVSDGDTHFLNAFGGDPAYTSSIFSRNAYRENVDAYKLGVSYSPMKGVKLMANYANYGQSDTLGFGSKKVASVTDAEEFDVVAVYKPNKDWMFKTFYANRTSEYDGAGGTERTQGHWRVIATYKF